MLHFKLSIRDKRTELCERLYSRFAEHYTDRARAGGAGMAVRERVFEIGLLAMAGVTGTSLAPAQTLQTPFLTTPGDASACAALSTLALPELAALEAQWIEAGSMRPANADPGQVQVPGTELPAYCRIGARVEAAIRIEVWLPAAAAWNGRFLGLGGTDFGGTLGLDRMAEALDAGYASASTDSGHRAGDSSWLSDVGMLRDFAYRAIYEMSEHSQNLLAGFYGRPADFRYFSGCALGGRQGLMEAQHFPGDYDGIVAGAPGAAFVDASITRVWAAQAARATGGQALLRPDLLAFVNAEAIAQCDTLDGAADGVLEDPRRCGFDPGRLQCGGSAGGRCLNPGEVTALRQIYAGPPEAEGSDALLPGFAVGSERGWSFAAASGLSPEILEFFRRAIFADPDWDSRNFDFAADTALARSTAAWMLDATATDLTAFDSAGGKLILYQGWNDTDSPPEATIDWYESVERALSPEAARIGSGIDDFARLFLVPGVAECSDTGTTAAEMQSAIENWVERGIAPDRVDAAFSDGNGGSRTHPLCPFPQIARYRGTGSGDRTGSFVCAN
jgi:feruloyl esterase